MDAYKSIRLIHKELWMKAQIHCIQFQSRKGQHCTAKLRPWIKNTHTRHIFQKCHAIIIMLDCKVKCFVTWYANLILPTILYWQFCWSSNLSRLCCSLVMSPDFIPRWRALSLITISFTNLLQNNLWETWWNMVLLFILEETDKPMSPNGHVNFKGKPVLAYWLTLCSWRQTHNDMLSLH